MVNQPVQLGMKRPFRLLTSFSLPARMNPRKKSKANTEASVAGSSSSSTGPELPPEASTTSTNTSTAPSDSEDVQNASSNKSLAESTATSDGASTPTTTGSQTPRGKKWLGGTGSWRMKAPAVVKTAKESIGVAGGATGELPGEEARKPRDDSPTKFLTKRKSSKGSALPTSITKVNVGSDGLTEEPKPPTPAKEDDDTAMPKISEPPLPPHPPPIPSTDQAANTWGWRSWWSRPDGYSEAGKARSEAQGTIQEAQSTPLPGPTPSEEADAKAKGLDSAGATQNSQAKDQAGKDATAQGAQDQKTQMQDAPNAAGKPQARNTSWFWGWSSAQNAQANPSEAPSTEAASAPKSDNVEVPPSETQPTSTTEEPHSSETAMLTTAEGVTETASTTTSSTPSKPSAWAFWYRGKPDVESKSTNGQPQKHVGEVAVFNTPSQSNPEAAQFNEQEQSPAESGMPKDSKQSEQPQEAPEPSKVESLARRSFRSLRGRPKSTSKPIETPVESPASSKAATPTKTSPVLEPTRPESAPSAQPAPKALAKAKQEPPNLLMPEFKTTYRLVQQPKFWQQIRQYFLGGEAPAPHLHINPAPPRIKKAVAIGVHGFFPAPIIQKVLGQPTGTSIRFANAAAAAIKDWTEARGYSPEIEQIALEGEGFIAERVNTLWKLLLNWIEHIKQADFILVACHSQGVPVAMMLVAKLIQFGCVNATRIGVCAMAGVNMGPFIEYKTKYFGPTAAELFEFSNPKSLVSQMYLAALDEVLRFGVRICYVGSIDDQLVSLESSTFSTLSHPYIYRAVFVDGRIHAPDFLTHLVGFALKLRNLGLPDHGLIRELSPALAGSLYGGEGHSRVYEDPAIYSLAVQHALETTSLPVAPKDRPSTAGSFQGINIPIIGEKPYVKDVYKLRVKDYEPSATSANPNPFFLPWAMRGLLEEDFVKKELGQEVEELLGMFEEWKPTAKQLKDVKFRLEGVRSKL
ncbi:hypothetical protein HBI56_084950 [Parastagonospora nodorum]|uniref:YMC020W-like alpha/beta hydrolase domain-containing protein n=2 Tax=Phaeosphaeria nodorum (strain SN15 / ATCC MYA-4574 / FGSC 10173) TaxID=321614 RepID=A0A7U2FFS8_PHANO|nr:hypothetical protein HBH56_101610 [Parastagonospora nodorum]QRD04455.1 hypothetical protein JI435_104230 [Parastagonospora nodorum SN15]KAH3929322.1 hypothetical protein HBH54_128820 [Parastagonospora nodorum]KAH4090395.1 hypothetical protein HBH46_190300 [Parastagonospora nodorum]KAH4122620.1 hypothetical protein HBH47_080190 [Parastagonospora nodorum]